MPFDALVMRAVEARWRTTIQGGICVQVQCAKNRLLLTIKQEGGRTRQVLLVLQPGLQRLHETSLNGLSQKSPTPLWMQAIIPFKIENIFVPPFERVMTWTITYRDDWGQSSQAKLIIELAGHLTNLVLTDMTGTTIEAWRKIAPGRPGRTIWPKLPYQPPTPPDLPSHDNLQGLPPWAKQWLGEGGGFETLLEDFQAGFLQGVMLTNHTREEVWVYPLGGFLAKPVDDLERALDAVFSRREIKLAQEALSTQLISQLQNRIKHLDDKLSQYMISVDEDESHWKMMGDLWLTYRYTFEKTPGMGELTVTDYKGKPLVLALKEGQTPSLAASECYRRYKKVKARKDAMQRLIPRLQKQRQELEALREDAQKGQHGLDWYKNQLRKSTSSPAEGREREPFRHFTSSHGVDIWVGRNRDENARLTFQKARPDDIWLHTKQAPGSHVILGCGKSQPNSEDLADAAELAVFFSGASSSSNVPVDYTCRKFVRKRPHAEPGQVLYQREKTLYITPSLERLRRLGAVSEKLIDD